MPVPMFIVDAFTREAFKGNPAAVCLLGEPRTDQWMQDVAREMNLSETAFVRPGSGHFELRWFTPKVEVDLCGHATLASAHVLWQTGKLARQQAARFQTRSGLLTASARDVWIDLDFPAKLVERCEPPAQLAAALGAPLKYVGQNRMDMLVEVDSEATVRALRPNCAALEEIPLRGIIVTAQSASPEYDFVSRFFAPRAGVNEDPVTGSAHCALAPFWSQRLHKNELVGFQASARGGVVRVAWRDDRVVLSGQAVSVLEGQFVG